MVGSDRRHPAPPPPDCAPGPLLTVVGGYGGEGFTDEWTWRGKPSFTGADDDRTTKNRVQPSWGGQTASAPQGGFLKSSTGDGRVSADKP